jgi:hypothetical protein
MPKCVSSPISTTAPGGLVEGHGISFFEQLAQIVVFIHLDNGLL